MKRVTFGMYYQVYGRIEAEVPDDVDDDDITEYLEEHWSEYPLPSDASYVQDSDELDLESIEIVKK